MQLRIFTKLEELEAIRESWEELIEGASSENIFLTPTWIITWCRYYLYDAAIRVIGVYEGSDLIGLAPLQVEKRRLWGLPMLERVRFLGADLSDRMDILLAPGREQEVLEAIVGCLFAQGWDLWDLDEIREDAQTMRLLPEIVQQQTYGVEITDCSTCPVVKLAPNVQTFRSPQRKNFWKKVDYSCKRLDREHAVEVRFNQGDARLGDDLAAFLTVYRASFRDRPSRLLDERFAAFRSSVAAQTAEQGRLLLALLLVDGVAVSGQLCFCQRQTCYAYNICHDPEWSRESVGTVLQWEVLRRLIEQRYVEYDFLRGGEDYKYRWGAVPVHQKRIRIWRNKPKARVVQAAIRLWRRSNPVKLVPSESNTAVQ